MTETIVKPEATPALYEHARTVYSSMLSLATTDDELELMVYEGHLTHLFKKLRLSVPYYTIIKNRLVAMGCIEQVKRGGGTAMSRWILWREPDMEAWVAATGQHPRPRGDRYTALEQRVRDLFGTLREMDKTIVSIEGQLRELRGVVERYQGDNVRGS